MSARHVRSRRFVALLSATLAVGIAGCDSADGTGGAASTSGQPVATVAPPSGQQWRDVASVTPEGGFLIGNPAAPIRLVEYASLTCPACAQFSQTAKTELEETYVNSGRVNFEIRSFLIHGPIDLALTRMVECGDPAAIHPRANQVWANLDPILNQVQAATPQLEAAMRLPPEQRFVAFADAADLYDFFAARGLSETQARQCLADTAALERLANNSQRFGEDGVTGTPTFFLNGQKLDANQWPAIQQALQAAGAR